MGLDGAATAAEPAAVAAAVEGNLHAAHAYPAAPAAARIEAPVPEPAARDHAQPDCRFIHHQAVECDNQTLRQADRANQGTDRQASGQGCRAKGQDRAAMSGHMWPFRRSCSRFATPSGETEPNMTRCTTPTMSKN